MMCSEVRVKQRYTRIINKLNSLIPTAKFASPNEPETSYAMAIILRNQNENKNNLPCSCAFKEFLSFEFTIQQDFRTVMTY